MPTRQGIVRSSEPDYAVAPGETLRQRLDELDMSQAELARRTGLTAKHINQIVQGAAALSADVALRLELVTDVPAYWWLRLEADYQATQVRLDRQRDTSKDDIGWVDAMPVDALVRAGVLPDEPRDKPNRLRQLLAFFGVASVDSYFALWSRPAASFRQSQAYSIDDAAVSAWLRLGEIAAQTLPTEMFDGARLRAVLPRLRALTRRPPIEGLPNLVRIAAECGVAVVFVPEVPGARAFGATRWINNGRRPIVQLSLRGKTDDKLWQTVFHEFGHILLHDRRQVFIEVSADDEPARQEQPVSEREAEGFARDLIIPPIVIDRLNQIDTMEQLVDFADALGVAPSLVVSRLHAENVWTYRQGAHLKHRVPDAAVRAAANVASGDDSAATAERRATRRTQWHLPGEGAR